MEFITPEETRSRLVNEISEAAGHRAGERADDTLGEVVQVFEFLHHPDLPAKARAILSQLFETYGRLALVDATFTRDKNHPARYLLADMFRLLTDNAVPDEDRDEVLAKVESVSNTIIGSFEGKNDHRPFEAGLTEIEKFRKGHIAKAALTKQREERVARARKLLEQARELASAAVNRLYNDHDISEGIGEFLHGPWHNVLTLTCLRHAPNSPEMLEVLSLARRMAEHADPEDFNAELVEAISDKLEMVGFQEVEAKPYLESIGDPYLSAAIAQLEKAPEPEEPAAPRPESEPDTGMQPMKAYVSREEAAELLSPGQWVRFKREEGEVADAKLSWKSPISHRLLFVDEHGLKVADREMNDVLDEIRSGETQLLVSNTS